MKAVSLNERKVRYMKLAMGCDPAAYRFYQKLLERMRDEGYDIIDIGCALLRASDPFFPLPGKW